MGKIFKIKAGRMAGFTVLIILCAGAIHSGMVFAQMPVGQQPMPGMPPDASGRRPGEDQMNPEQHEMMAKMALQRNSARQQQLVKDTDKLLALATELKSDVDKTNKNVLSIDVIKKAEEIEKLAKNVKERMKD
jgi:hypothetical protein